MPLTLADPTWYPIASAEDLPFRHVYQAQLLGRELAVWRADDGNVNVWENRCLHRGVRLSIGINEGQELKCQYHGWRYANRSAGCTYIPAHPADAPSRRIENKKYPVREAFGLIWSAATDDTPYASFPGADAANEWFPLRPLPVNAEPDDVVAALARLAPDDQPADILPGLSVRLGLARFFVQPVDAGRSVIRGLFAGIPDDPLATLRAYNDTLTKLREQVERAAAKKLPPAPLEPSFDKVSVELSTMPDIAIPRGNTLTVLVKRKWQTADGVVGFELAARDGHLPTFQPGAHIDVHLPNGLIRQYSITNGPGELLSYIIGVKQENASTGGSKVLVESVRENDLLTISEPRNNFPLRRDATRTVLIAGGIGITPLLSMARFLDQSSLPYELHYFVRDEQQVAFKDQLNALRGKVIFHIGVAVPEVAPTIATLLGPHSMAQHVYVCGPGPMLETVRTSATAQGWPDEAIHFEYFKNDKVIDDSSSFEIELARSAMTLQVPAGRTILEVMREAGLTVPSSCEQGACGTCLTTVMEGEVDHQDVYLNDTEKASNTCMMTCVSRAKSPRLILDI
jgi:ferredoxin-NADP reductase/nitrite reductase/ring-hydroxylating ferredoxin subunit